MSIKPFFAGWRPCVRPDRLAASMTDPLRNTWRARIGAIILAFTVGLGFGLLLTDTAEAHTPQPIACQIAWKAAPVGGKWQARQRCVAAQKSHVREHRVAARVAEATRMCLRTGYRVLSSGMCRAIATVKPSWASSWAYHELLDRESGGDPNAVNESSGACGAFQRLKCPWRYYGGTSSPRDDRVHATPLEQTRNGVRYIVGRYGSPAAAIRFHDANGWY